MQDEANDLRCNSLRCRKMLIEEGKAVTTTCSHIFCIDCATDLFEDSQTCPACHTNLAERDDIILSSLEPSEEYKSSCLAGLSPQLIMDIAGRAFRFWQYQHSEEAGFQAMLLRDVQEKLAVVENKHQGQAREFSSQVSALQMQVSNVTLELHGERRRVQALIKSHQEQENEIKRVKSSVIANRRNSLTERGTRSTMHIPQQERLERLETPPHTAQYAPPTPSRIATANIYAMQNASHSNGYNVYNGYERTSAAFGFNRGGPFEAVNKSPVKRISTSSPIKTHALSRKTYLHR